MSTVIRTDHVAAADFKSGKREAQYKWRQLADEWDAISKREVVATADAASSPTCQSIHFDSPKAPDDLG